MYTEFFGLNEKPFAITPDPRYLYLSARHTDALAHLVYGVSESGGFIQLTGEVGTGKTTLVRSLLEQRNDSAQIALILNPQLTRLEFLQAICSELQVAPPEENTVKGLIDALNRHLLEAHAAGRRIVLIVDEAQTLDAELLEQVRLLTNLETARQKLLQIILIGQPELRDLLDRREMRQVAQRITGRYHLEPLDWDDTVAYISHRIRVAGGHPDVFEPSAIREIYRQSGGIPRLINVIADHALLAAYTRDSTRVDRRLVRQAAAEVFGGRGMPMWLSWSAAGMLAGTVLLSIVLSMAWLRWQPASVDAASARATDGAGPVAELTPQGTSEEAPSLMGTPSAGTAAPESAQRYVSLRELLDDPSISFATDTAVTRLFSLWGATYEPDDGTACDQAEAFGLRCLIENGSSISQLRRLNRPAILSLRGDRGVEYQVVITALGYDYAEIDAGDGPRKIGLSDLTHHWFGSHLLLWRPETVVSRDLVPGTTDEAVPWLRDALGRVRGETFGDPDSRVYDRQLETAVRAYQRDRLLTVDGIVGTKTLITLTTDLGAPDTPWLRKPH